jgi:hypothetical protein
LGDSFGHIEANTPKLSFFSSFVVNLERNQVPLYHLCTLAASTLNYIYFRNVENFHMISKQKSFLKEFFLNNFFKKKLFFTWNLQNKIIIQ